MVIGEADGIGFVKKVNSVILKEERAISNK